MLNCVIGPNEDKCYLLDLSIIIEQFQWSCRSESLFRTGSREWDRKLLNIVLAVKESQEMEQ